MPDPDENTTEQPAPEAPADDSASEPAAEEAQAAA